MDSSNTRTRRSGAAYGNGEIRTPFTALKIAAFAPMQRARVSVAVAAKAGFDWTSAKEVEAKLAEELSELDQAVASGREAQVEEEMGDVLFALVNLARHLGVDAEVALSSATDKFVDRFKHLERALQSQGRSVSDADMEELDRLWEEAKIQRREKKK